MLTAAHCTDGKPAEDVEVIVGEHSRVNIYNGTVMTRVGVRSKSEDPDFTDHNCGTTKPLTREYSESQYFKLYLN